MQLATNFKALRFSPEDSERIRMLTQRIAANYQNQFVAGGDNEELKKQCQELMNERNAIEAKYR